MINFIAALINDAGEVVAAVASDSPIPAGQPPIGGLRLVSVAAVIAKPVDGAAVDLPPLARAGLHKHITREADGTYRLAESARAHIETIMHGPATDADLAAAAEVHPMVAHWLQHRLHAAHPLKPRVDAAVTARPILADRAARLHQQRFDPHGAEPAAKGFAVVERAARETQIAASAWADMTAAIKTTEASNA